MNFLDELGKEDVQQKKRCLSCYDYLEGHGRYQAQRRRGAETTNAKREQEKRREVDVETDGGTDDES